MSKYSIRKKIQINLKSDNCWRKKWIYLARVAVLQSHYSGRSTCIHIWDACFVTNAIEPHLSLNYSQFPVNPPDRGWLLPPLKCSQCAFLRIKTNIESSGTQFVQIKPVFWPIICAPAAVQCRCSETVWQHINMQRIIQPRRAHTRCKMYFPESKREAV